MAKIKSELVCWLKEHKFDAAIPRVPLPDWAIKLGIPVTPVACNRGIFEVVIPWYIVGIMLFGLDQANSMNRDVKRQLLRELKLAFENGTFIPFLFDSVVIDWNWKIVSGQKRLLAGYETYLAGKLHPRYKDGLPVRIEYGVDPAARCQSDNVQHRDRQDQVKLVESLLANKEIHQSVTLAVKLHWRLNTSAIGGEDAKKVYDSNPEGFEWSASLKRSPLNIVPVRVALAEGFKLNPDKTKAFASELFNVNYTGVEYEPVAQAKSYHEYRDKVKNSVENGDNQGPDQRNHYYRAVYALDCWFNDASASRVLSAKAELAGWSGAQKAELDYPELFIVDRSLEKESVDLKQFGITNQNVGESAVRIVLRSNHAVPKVIEQHVKDNADRWFAACAQLKVWRKMLDTYSWGAVLAFSYLNPRWDAQQMFTPKMSTELDFALARIKGQHNGLGSRAARDACLEVLYTVTGVRNVAVNNRRLVNAK